jgi:hypothetical protein
MSAPELASAMDMAEARRGRPSARPEADAQTSPAAKRSDEDEPKGHGGARVAGARHADVRASHLDDETER